MSLQKIAKQLSNLNANTPEKAGLITYPIGALYCAFEAQRSNFADRISSPKRWRIELDAALAASREIAVSKRPSESDWTRIVHFNSALMRIDVGFERLIQYITGSTHCNLNKLLPLAKKRGVPTSTLQKWERIRKYEVNRLKHHNPGALTKDRIKFADMVKALQSLVDLLKSKL